MASIAPSLEDPKMEHYVSHTAVMVAHLRAQESPKANPLFVDPIASKMYDPEVS